MNPKLIQLYHECRRWKPFMLSGRDAECSLSSARTLFRFRELEARGLVRMRAEPEDESYFDVFGEPEGYINKQGHWVSAEKEREEQLENFEAKGVWVTFSEFWCGDLDEDGNPECLYADGHNSETADSCGMHTGYNDPLDPFENCYVIGEMAEAVERMEALLAAQELKRQLAD